MITKVNTPTRQRQIVNSKGDGIITRDNLPRPGYGSRGERWTIKLRADVAKAIHEGVITMEEAVKRYGASVDEWQANIDRVLEGGPEALKIRHLQPPR